MFQYRQVLVRLRQGDSDIPTAASLAPVSWVDGRLRRCIDSGGERGIRTGLRVLGGSVTC